MSKNASVDEFASMDNFDVGDTQPVMYSGDDIIDMSVISEEVPIDLVPPGIYPARIDSVEKRFSQRSGNPMLTWTLKANVGDRERTFFYHTVLHGVGLNMLKRLLVRLQPHANEEFEMQTFNPNDASILFTGVPCRVRLRLQRYEGKDRNSVSEILAPEEELSELDF